MEGYKGHILAIEEENMCECRRDCGEPEAVTESKDNAQVNLALFKVGCIVQGEVRVKHSLDVVTLPGFSEELGRENGEVLGFIQVVPIGDRDQDIDEEHESDRNIDNDKEWRDQRAE